MKKLWVFILVIFVMGAAVHADSFLENSYYVQSQLYKELAENAFDDGDYDAAADYAAQSMEYARLSDEFVAHILSIMAADDAIDEAEAKIAWAESIHAPRRYEAEYNEALLALEAAWDLYHQENFYDAKAEADRVGIILFGLYEGTDLPATYTARSFPVNTDCFWNIAALPFVYNDPYKWPYLYQANKSRMVDPSNPDLIHPGFLVEIPSIDGEYRWGEWQEGLDYPVFGEERE